MPRVELGKFAVIGSLTLALVLGGCVGAEVCAGGNSPSGQLAVCNKQDSFSFGTNAGMASSTNTYTWENSKPKAKISWGSNLGMGSVTVVLQDATGKQVFSNSYSGVGQSSNTVTSSAGEAGEWTIRVELKSVSGQVGITVNAAS